MKKFILILIITLPFFAVAQKGVIKPDTKPSTPANTTIKNNNASLPNDIKIWVIEENAVSCIDSVSKCYVVNENGITKTISQNDIFNFFYEEGYKFTVWVKEELKTPPIPVSSGNYNYTVVKTVSKKLIDKNNASSNAYTEIPTVSKKDKYIISNAATDITTTEVAVTNNDNALRDDVELLKKQVKELKKQVEVMQLMIDMQLQLIQKK